MWSLEYGCLGRELIRVGAVQIYHILKSLQTTTRVGQQGGPKGAWRIRK